MNVQFDHQHEPGVVDPGKLTVLVKPVGLTTSWNFEVTCARAEPFNPHLHGSYYKPSLSESDENVSTQPQSSPQLALQGCL